MLLAACTAEPPVSPGRTPPASPDVDLALGHHAPVVEPLERMAGERAAHRLANHIARHPTSGHPSEESVPAGSSSTTARFSLTHGVDGRITVTRAEAVPLLIEPGAEAVHVLPAAPASFARVSEVLGCRGAGATAGPDIVAG